MEKLTFAILGLGNRGTEYIRHLLTHKEHATITAIADNRQICLDAANKLVNLPENMLFNGADSIQIGRAHV